MKWKIIPNTKKGQPNIQIRIRVKTPQGKAKDIEKKWGVMLRTFILGKNVPKISTDISESQMVWTLITNLSQAMKISKRLGMYESIIKGVFDNKLLKKGITKYFSKEQQAEVQDMLLHHTKIEMIDPQT